MGEEKYTSFIFYGESHQTEENNQESYFPKGDYRMIDGVMCKLLHCKYEAETRLKQSQEQRNNE